LIFPVRKMGIEGVKLSFKSIENCDVLEIELGKPIEPSVLAKLDNMEFRKILLDHQTGDVLVISGRAPIWLYCFLLHETMHLWKAVATFDPKIGGAIIVGSHTPKYGIGDIIHIGGAK